MKMSFVLALFLLLAQSAQATLTVACVSGYCGSNVTPSITAPSKIFFSNIGAAYSAAGGGACATTINPNCKQSTDLLKLTFSSTSSSMTSTTNIYMYTNTTTPLGDPVASASLSGTGLIASTTYAAGGFSTISFQNICNVATNLTTDCQAEDSAKIHIIADVNNNGAYDAGTDEIYSFTLVTKSSITQFSTASTTGLYSFIAYPGDEKVKIKSVGTEESFPNISNPEGIQYARFYYIQSSILPAGTMSTDLDNMDPTANTYSYIDISMSGNEFSTHYLKPLNNLSGSSVYCFLSTLVDYAGNVGFIMPTPRNAGTTGYGDGMCAQPSQVAGLIAENGHCFIATAAFGSSMAKQVQILRNFRDQFLLKTKWGKNFVSWYYKNSPPWAEKISHNENARRITRTFLWPFVGYSILALKWGAVNAALFSATVLLLPFLFIQFYVFRRRRKT